MPEHKIPYIIIGTVFSKHKLPAAAELPDKYNIAVFTIHINLDERPSL